MECSTKSPDSTKSNLELIVPDGWQENNFTEQCSSLRVLIKPRPPLNVWQWAEKFRYVAKGASAKTLDGKRLYRSSDAPHQRKPQEMATDPSVQVVVLVMASQVGGKTEIFNNVLGYHMDYKPRNCVVMYPTIDAAEKYSKKKFSPMAEASPVLAKLLRPSRSRDSGNTILVKDFAGGSVFFVGANSSPSLRQASGAVLLGDEIDSNTPDPAGEGDPVELLFRRGESFSSCVKMLASTPTLKGLSAIWSWFDVSDQEYWFIPCLKCGAYQMLKWFQIQWPKDSAGISEPEKSYLVCQQCSAALSDRQRVEMYFNGEWRATAPFKGIAGFHLNGIYAPWPHQKGYQSRLHQMASEFLRAKKSPSRLKVWTNTFLAEPWEEEAPKKLEIAPIMKRAESYTPQSLPIGTIILLAAVDVQKTWLQAEVIGVGLDDETWGVESVKIEGDTEQDDAWNDLAELLTKAYTRADGVTLKVASTAIDMGHKPTRVQAFIKASGIPAGLPSRPGIYPVYGATHRQNLLVVGGWSKHYQLRTYKIDTHVAKDTIFARLQVPEAGPRYMHFPVGYGYNEEFFAQLTAEVLKTTFERGVGKQRYEPIRDRNEALDIRVYQLGAIDILKPNLTSISKKLKPLAVPDQGAGDVSQAKEYQLQPPGGPPPSPPAPAPGQRQRLKIRVGGNWGRPY